MYFNRVSYKKEAKDYLKGRYLKALGAAMIVGILGGSMNGSFSFNLPGFDEFAEKKANVFSSQFDSMSSQGIESFGVIIPIFLSIILLSFLYSVFIGGPAMVGSSRYFLGEDEDISVLFSGFKGDASRARKTAFLVYVKVFLWTCLFIIPGIIAAYSYRFVPYVLAENPEMTPSEILEESKKLTNGIKTELWVMDISFLGWLLLGSLIFGVGQLLVAPYIEKSFANAYKSVKLEASDFVEESIHEIELTPVN